MVEKQKNEIARLAEIRKLVAEQFAEAMADTGVSYIDCDDCDFSDTIKYLKDLQAELNSRTAGKIKAA